MYTLLLKKNEEKRILRGEPWVFANEVLRVEGEGKQGDVCRVCAADGRFVALGYINHLSKIIVRVLSYKEEPIDETFFERRIRAALNYRLALGYDCAYRVVFGESDLLPALIVDKYGDYLSCQFLSLGMEKRKQLIVDILVKIFNPKGIYERSDVAVRKKEGLEEKTGLLYGEVPDEVIIEENGLKMIVDIKGGQKTGYFLDQKENRAELKNYVSGKRVLDCFCNVGGFSLCAAKYGATEVTAVDVSRAALDIVEKNAAMNGFSSIIKTRCADVFELLRECRKSGEKFDVIVLDPPAFTKSKDTVKDGLRGYKDINVQAMKLLAPGGILITNSCSQHISVNAFLDMLAEAAYQSDVTAKLITLREQGMDHASIVGFEESLYLKTVALYIMEK